ncbi:MAG: SixA phosphatase family protein [Ilumatobacteraceae bacterium]
MLYLVRHAKAGSRHDWEGDDRDRPLDAAGEAQADALAVRLAPLATGRLVSSPYTRCVRTLEPLARLVGTPLETDRRLAENGLFTEVFELFDELPDGSVLCSHGDVIPDVMQALERRGCAITGPIDWRKASTWVLTRQDGAVTGAECWPPPC